MNEHVGPPWQVASGYHLDVQVRRVLDAAFREAPDRPAQHPDSVAELEDRSPELKAYNRFREELADGLIVEIKHEALKGTACRLLMQSGYRAEIAHVVDGFASGAYGQPPAKVLEIVQRGAAALPADWMGDFRVSTEDAFVGERGRARPLSHELRLEEERMAHRPPSRRRRLAFCGLLIAASLPLHGQAPEFDLLIRNGHVIDPRNGIDAVRDVAVAGGRIARVAEHIAPELARRIADARGLYVTPGLIDLHAHVFWGTEPHAAYSNGYSAVPPDSHSFRSGQTTLVDVGGAGWRNFPQFKEQVIDRARTRVLAFINIVGSGMKGGPIEQDRSDMDARLTAMRIRQFPETIVGIKVAHYSGPEWDPVTRAVEAGRLTDVPVMIDFGGHTPPLPLEDLLLTHLRPGDILTHTYAHVRGRIPIVDEAGRVRPSVWEARKRGVIFDVGHGGGSFLFRQAVPAMEQGFHPDVISTDLHVGSMNGGMQDILNTMSKFLNMGMPLQEVIRSNTARAAEIVKRADLGHLGVGAEADIAVLNLRRGTFGFIDVGGGRLAGDRKLECELTVKGGQVVWDLNGISHPVWTELAERRP